MGKLMNEVSSTVRCDRYPFYFHLFFPKLDKIRLYNTKLTSREIEPFFLAMIPEDLEAKKHILVHNILEQIYTLFHENTNKGKKLVKKLM